MLRMNFFIKITKRALPPFLGYSFAIISFYNSKFNNRAANIKRHPFSFITLMVKVAIEQQLYSPTVWLVQFFSYFYVEWWIAFSRLNDLIKWMLKRILIDVILDRTRHYPLFVLTGKCIIFIYCMYMLIAAT